MKHLLFSFLLFLVVFSNAQSANELLQKSIAYHDPNGEWKNLKATFTFRETRPDGPDRKTIFTFDNSKNAHTLNRNDEEIYEVTGSKVKVLKGDKGEERGKTMRNYYVYLWGLPMKLADKGTPLSEKVTKKTIDKTPCLGITVAYEKETWTYFLDAKTYRMVAYQFFRNDGTGNGEFIKLEGEVPVGRMKIPKARSWYEFPGDKFLGTDILEAVR